LSAVQVDELVALYSDGLSIAEVSRKLGIYTRTAAAHLVRRSVPLRQRGLVEVDTLEAVRLYESALTLVEVGLRFGVSQQAVRRAVAAEGVETRPRGRRPCPTA
jgi:transposase-like protein